MQPVATASVQAPSTRRLTRLSGPDHEDSPKILARVFTDVGATLMISDWCVQALGLALVKEGFRVLPQGAANDRLLHLLQIALNMKSSQPAEYILETHSDALKAAIQHKVLNDLLRTAVRRTKHGCFLGAGCSEDPTEEGVGGRRGGYVRGYDRSVVMMLCTFPAAQELSQKDVGDLMGLAIRHAPYLMEFLHPLPGAQRLTEGDLDDLLLKSARFHDDDSLNGKHLLIQPQS